jgi:two-component system sensor histidine kinase DesK
MGATRRTVAPDLASETMWSRGGRDGPMLIDPTAYPKPVGFGALGRRNRLVWEFISLLWLTILVAPMTDLLDGSDPAIEKVLLGLAGGGFAVGYVLVPRAVRRPPTWRTSVGLAVMAMLLAVLAVVDDWAWLNAMVFVTVSIGMRLPTERAVRVVLGLTAATVLLAAALGADADGLYSIGLTCFAVGFMCVGIRRIIDVNRELQVAQQDLARLAVAEERDRFARDLTTSSATVCRSSP